MTIEQILAKWEARIAPTLAEDYATADLYDWLTAQELNRLIQEIKTAINQKETNTMSKTTEQMTSYGGDYAPTPQDHIRDLHDAATRFEDRAKRAEQQRDSLLAALSKVEQWLQDESRLEDNAKYCVVVARAAIAAAEGRAS